MATRSDLFVSGIHSYCDRCCWRCRLNDRCAVFAKAWRAIDRASPPLPNDAVAAAVAGALIYAVEAHRSTARDRPDKPPGAASALRAAGRTMQEPRLDDDPLVASAGEYARTAWPILQALRPVLAVRDDGPSREAAERLEEICITVASKIYRATASALDEGLAASALQSDANGSAKIALLLIEESRRAWRVLMRPGRAVGNGAPAALVRMLDGLETGVRLRFPRAMEFVRPGFDTDDPHSMDGRIAAAVRAPPARTGTA